MGPAGPARGSCPGLGGPVRCVLGRRKAWTGGEWRLDVGKEGKGESGGSAGGWLSLLAIGRQLFLADR